MSITYLMLNHNKDSDINYIINQIENLNERINLIDSNLKFNIATLLSVLGIAIALVSIISFIGIKNWIENIIDKHLSKRLEFIIDRAPKYEVMSGDKRLSASECVDGKFSFIIGKRDLNIKFDKENTISIKPIIGEDVLEYKAEVINGQLNVEMENFDRDKYKGIRWKIVYLK